MDTYTGNSKETRGSYNQVTYQPQSHTQFTYG